MPNKQGQKKVGDNIEIKATVVEPTKTAVEVKIEPVKPIIEEKVEVIIKEIIRIKPSDFSAFKHALEEFVSNWDN